MFHTVRHQKCIVTVSAQYFKMKFLLLQIFSLALIVLCNSRIGSLLQIITSSGAIGLQSNSACLVGHLHLAHVSTSHSHTAGKNGAVHLWTSMFSQFTRILGRWYMSLSLFISLFSSHVVSPSGFQLPPREKPHPIHRWLHLRGREKRLDYIFNYVIFFNISHTST